MNRIAYALAYIFMSWITSACSQDQKPSASQEEPKDEESISEVLSKNARFFSWKEHPKALEILTTPDSVETFTMGSRYGAEGKTLASFPVESQGANLSPSTVESLRKMLLAENHLRLNPIRKCRFSPQKAVRFKKGKEDLLVLLSFSCQQIQIQQSKDVWVMDSDALMQPLNKIIAWDIN